MGRKYNFGILGCGMIANIHFDAILGIENVEVVGVADVKKENAVRFSMEHGIHAYEDFNDMLNDDNIDVVCLCTPSGFHAENAIEALMCKKHVVLEKPMAINKESANQVIDACDKSGCKLTVISQLRFSNNIQRVKKLMNAAAFGKIVSCDLYMKYWREPSYYESSPWKGTYKFDGGGALMNQGIHGVDLLQYLVGKPTVKASSIRTLVHNIETEDLAVAILEFGGGALGVIEASTCAKPGFERKIEIIGTDGYVILREGNIEELCINGDKSLKNELNKNAANSSSDPAAIESYLHGYQIKNLINAIEGKEDLLVDAREGRKAVEIICDIYKLAGKDK